MNTIDLSTEKILDLWSELEAAYYGRNGYGGTVAEIYAYRCVSGEAADFDSYRDRNAVVAGANLTEILRRFARRHECVIGLQSGPDEFTTIDIANKSIGPFDHRIHLEIVDLSRLGQDAKFALATATGRGLYDLVAKAFHVGRDEAKRRLLATIYGKVEQ